MKSFIRALFLVTVIAFVATLVFTSCYEKGFAITANGKPKCRIVTGEKPPETVAFAAKELQLFVKKMSGAELPIMPKPDPETPSIRLGPAARELISAAEFNRVKRDGYIIAVTNGDLCIAGIDDSGPQADIEELLKKNITHSVPLWSFNRGTLYGVYRLLEELGMRWFLPGNFGERAPKIKSLAFTAGTIAENPHFISRTVGYWTLGLGAFNKRARGITIMPGERAEIGFTPAENRMWELRMRGATYQIPLNHYPTSTRWVERFGTNHPEYFALLPDGKRDNFDRNEGHLCYTCPGVVDESAADIQAYAEGKECEARGISRIHPITKRPTNEDNRGWPEHIAFGEYFSLLPHDGFRCCACAECAKLVSKSGVKGEEHSQLVWPYIAKVAEKVQTNKITCLAYGSYSRPYPGMPKLPPNVTVGYCGYSHPASLLYKDKFEEYKKVVKQWADLANGQLAFWQHYLASNRSEENIGMPEHTPEIYAKVARVMAQHGNHVFCEQMADSIMFELFNRYLLMKMFYNPALNEKSIFTDYIMRFYGPEAGPLIGEIYGDIEKKCVEKYAHNYAAYSFWEKLFDQPTMRAYRKKTDLALKKATGTEYEQAVLAFRKYYLGLMERGRLRYSDPLALLLEGFNPEFTCRPLKTPLKLDGKLDEPIWKAYPAVAISNNVAGKPVLNLTAARTCYDSQHVYFAVSADAPGIDQRPADGSEPGQADGIAIYLDVPHDRRGYCRLGIDRAGKLQAARCDDAAGGSITTWESGASAAVVTSASNYVVEVSIPRSALGAPDGDLSFYDWGVLVGRVQAGAAWTNERLSSTSRLLRGAFEQPLYFNTMRFSER